MFIKSLVQSVLCVYDGCELHGMILTLYAVILPFSHAVNLYIFILSFVQTPNDRSHRISTSWGHIFVPSLLIISQLAVLSWFLIGNNQIFWFQVYLQTVIIITK